MKILEDGTRVISEWTTAVLAEGEKINEQHMRLLVHPRPRWVPRSVWRWVLGKVLVVEIGPH